MQTFHCTCTVAWLLTVTLSVGTSKNRVLRQPHILRHVIGIGNAYSHEHQYLLLHLLTRLAAEQLVSDPRDVAQ